MKSFNLNVIGTRLINGFLDVDTAAKIEAATALPKLAPYTVTDGEVHLNRPLMGQLLPLLLRSSYKRQAFAVANERPVMDVAEEARPDGFQRRVTDMEAATGKKLTKKQLAALEKTMSAEQSQRLFNNEEHMQFDVQQDMYKPSAETAELESAMLEHIKVNLAKDQGGQYRWLVQGFSNDTLIDGVIVDGEQSYPCPKDVQQWRRSTLKFLAEQHKLEFPDKPQPVTPLARGIAAIGGAYYVPSWSGNGKQTVQAFVDHWQIVKDITTETAGERAVEALFKAVEEGDKKRALSALKKWELMRASSAAMKYFDALVADEAWGPAKLKRKIVRLNLMNGRAQAAAETKREEEQFALMDKYGWTSAQALVHMEAAKAVAKAKAPEGVQAKPVERMVGPKEPKAAKAKAELKAAKPKAGVRKSKVKSLSDLKELIGEDDDGLPAEVTGSVADIEADIEWNGFHEVAAE